MDGAATKREPWWTSYLVSGHVSIIFDSTLGPAMFILLLAAVLAAAAVHFLRVGARTRHRAGSLLLRWVLAGYCGIPMVLVAALLLVHPHEAAEALGFEPDHPFALFLGWAYLGMAASAALTLRLGGTYLVGPAVAWAIFFLGATLIHVGEAGGAAAVGHGGLLQIVASHGAVSALLMVGLALGGARAERPAPRRAPAD